MKQTKIERLLPREQRPYEKCQEKGAEALTNQELIAILLRTGSVEESALELAGRILHSVPGEEGLKALTAMSLEQLMQIRGIGKVKAMQGLFGLIMKELKGVGDPAVIRKLLEEKLNSL